LYPIRLGAVEDFEIARELLLRTNFTDRLFVDGAYVDEATLRQHVSAPEIDALDRLGLIVQEQGKTWSPVQLHPVDGVYTVFDRWKTPDGKQLEGREDIVYPSIVANTRLFLDLLPDSPCDSFLDLCSGTGVAALIAASKYAVSAYAYDIAPRSTHFAEFARRLNGLSNVTTGTGDLYEPADGVTFDRVVAHPPYVPVLESKWIFFDGGDDGERVTRRIVEGLPRYLRPGGSLYCLAMASDRADQPLEQRIREWLGAEHREFDIAVVVRRVLEPEEFALKTGRDAKKWKEVFDAHHITALPYAMMMVQRKATGRLPFTVRRQSGPQTSRADHEWLLDWETRIASDATAILEQRPSAAPGCDLRVLNRITDGDWEPVEYLLSIDQPFRMEMKIDPWIAYLLTRCDGTKTVSQLFDELKSDGVILGETPQADFAQVVNTLGSGGFLSFPAAG